MNYNFYLKPRWLFILSLFLFHDVTSIDTSMFSSGMLGESGYRGAVIKGTAISLSLLFAYRTTKSFIGWRQGLKAKAKNVEAKLPEISKWLNASKSVVMHNAVDQVNGNHWFNWRTKRPGASNETFSWDSINIVSQDSCGRILQALIDDLVHGIIHIHIRQPNGLSEFRPQFVRSNAPEQQNAQPSIPTLEAILRSIDDEILRIQEFKQQVAELTRFSSTFLNEYWHVKCFLDEYWRIKRSSRTIEDSFNDLCRQRIPEGILYNANNEVIETLKNDFLALKYSRKFIITLRLLFFNQNFKIAYNKTVDIYWKLIKAETRDQLIRAIVANELARRQGNEAPQAGVHPPIGWVHLVPQPQ